MHQLQDNGFTRKGAKIGDFNGICDINLKISVGNNKMLTLNLSGDTCTFEIVTLLKCRILGDVLIL